MKWYLGGVTGLFTVFGIFVSGFILVASWNFNSERIALRDFQKDIREDIGKSDAPPNLVLLGKNNEPIDNQDIVGKLFKDDDGTIKLGFKYTAKNDSKSSTGPLHIKIYSCDPIQLNHRSTDETKFDYEDFIKEKNIDPKELPGGNYTLEYTLEFSIFYKEPPTNKKFPILLKIYYGKGKVVQSIFNLILVQK